VSDLDEDDIHVPVFDNSDFFSASELAKNASLDAEPFSIIVPGQRACVVIYATFNLGQLVL
jgi:hypothetical protein